MTAEATTSPEFEHHPMVRVVIEIPRGSFLKRGSSGRLDFISPLPCPFNYGSVHGFMADDNDWLDALVLGPRLPVGASVELPAFGAVGFTDRDIYDDKLVCASQPPTASQRHLVLQFFHLYARCKRLLNIYRRRPGRTACDGWGDARVAIERTQCSEDASARGQVPF